MTADKVNPNAGDGRQKAQLMTFYSGSPHTRNRHTQRNIRGTQLHQKPKPEHRCFSALSTHVVFFQLQINQEVANLSDLSDSLHLSDLQSATQQFNILNSHRACPKT